MRRLTISIEWGRGEPERPEASAQGCEAMVESARAEWDRPLGFAPPSDPIRRGDDGPDCGEAP